jgi:parallel beta-helix repeat protein
MFSEVGEGYCGDAIRLRDAENCVIEENEFRHLGGNGIYLQMHDARNLIRYNRFQHCGTNAVVLAGAPVLGVSKDPEHPLFNEVTDNEIHHCGVFDKSTAGVFLGRSESNIVAHNLIHDMPHHAVNLGSNPYGRNFVEYNRIHHVCVETHDTGAINSWMDVPREWERSGHFIRYNFISDVLNPTSKDLAFYSGIYLDDESSNCLVYGNVIVRTRIGVFVKGKNNVVENNIFANALPVEPSQTAAYAGQLLVAGHSHHFPWFSASDRAQKNIFYNPLTAVNVSWTNDQPLPAALRYLQESDYNIYFTNTGDLRFRVEGLPGSPITFSDWQKATGFDSHSVVADPMFVDPAHDDYRLRPESPAIRLGFVPINLDAIGIRPKPH